MSVRRNKPADSSPMVWEHEKYAIYFPREVMRQVAGHARKGLMDHHAGGEQPDEDREVMGIFLGSIAYICADGRVHAQSPPDDWIRVLTTVHRFLPLEICSHYQADYAQLRAEDTIFIHQECRRSSLQNVGWFHTHVIHSIHLSAYDRKTTLNNYRVLGSFAMVGKPYEGLAGIFPLSEDRGLPDNPRSQEIEDFPGLVSLRPFGAEFWPDPTEEPTGPERASRVPHSRTVQPPPRGASPAPQEHGPRELREDLPKLSMFDPELRAPYAVEIDDEPTEFREAVPPEVLEAVREEEEARKQARAMARTLAEPCYLVDEPLDAATVDAATDAATDTAADLPRPAQAPQSKAPATRRPYEQVDSSLSTFHEVDDVHFRNQRRLAWPAWLSRRVFLLFVCCGAVGMIGSSYYYNLRRPKPSLDVEPVRPALSLDVEPVRPAAPVPPVELPKRPVGRVPSLPRARLKRRRHRRSWRSRRSRRRSNSTTTRAKGRKPPRPRVRRKPRHPPKSGAKTGSKAPGNKAQKLRACKRYSAWEELPKRCVQKSKSKKTARK